MGKSTAVETVATALRQATHEVLCTREPGGTSLGEQLRALLLDPDLPAMAATTELLLMFAARAEHLDKVIHPALAAGQSVVCDRFTDASYAYQGGGRGMPIEQLSLAEQIVHPDFAPQLTLLLDAPAEIALPRAKARGNSDRFEREDVAFFNRIRECYLERARREPQRFVLIDAAQPLEAVSSAITAAVTTAVKSL